MVDQKLTQLGLGTSATWLYGVDAGGNSKKFTGSLFQNVLNYGADPSGNTDSSGAIRAAMAASNQAAGGIIFFPLGTYRIDSTIYVDGPSGDGSQPNNSYYFLGSNDNTDNGAGVKWGTHLNGVNIGASNFIFKRNNGASQQQTLVWQGFTFENSKGGIYFEGGSGVRILDCNFGNFWGVLFNQTIGRLSVENCTFAGGNASGEIGVYANGNLVIKNCTFNSKEHGVRVGNAGTVIQGCQIEKCSRGIVLGQNNPEGSGFDSCTAVIVEGNTFESCDIGIYVRAASFCSIRGNQIIAFRGPSPPLGVSSYGIYFGGTSNCGDGSTFENNLVSGDFAGGAIFQPSAAFAVNAALRGTSGTTKLTNNGLVLSGIDTIPIYYGTTGITNPPWLVAGQGINTVNNSGTIIPSGTHILSFPSNTQIKLSNTLIANLPDNTEMFVFDAQGNNHLIGGVYFSNPAGNNMDISSNAGMNTANGLAGGDPITRLTAGATLDPTMYNLIEINSAGATTLTIPTDAGFSAALAPSGIYHVTQVGAGGITLDFSAVTVQKLASDSLSSTNQWQVMSFTRVGPNIWRFWQGH